MSGEPVSADPLVYLVHHAPAIGPKEDPQQPLSPVGRATADDLARAAAARGVRPQMIWHSGKLRARQTAEAFWRACNPLAAFTAVRNLQPADSPEWMRDQLLAEDAPVLIVGHMPHIARLLRIMVGRDADPGTPEFPPHGMVCLARSEAIWIERWRLVS
jgi:phosphohistidine phosphatase